MGIEFALAVHGGAGALDGTRDDARTASMRIGIRDALLAGKHVLENGGTSVEAVEASVRALEDNPVFNAGKGAVLASDGKHYLDAAIMRGEDKAAGAVGAATIPKNPVTLARRIMERGKEILIVGEHADNLANALGVETLSNTYFNTDFRSEQFRKAREAGGVVLDHTDFDDKKGTVGAVALDSYGNLASATSTGGMTNKSPGRVGDSPLIGAGTYATNEACAVSCTGVGELFIKENIAGRLASLIQDSGKTLLSAAKHLIHRVLPEGSGGLIAIAPDGEIFMPFNSKGMARGSITSAGGVRVSISAENDRDRGK